MNIEIKRDGLRWRWMATGLSPDDWTSGRCWRKSEAVRKAVSELNSLVAYKFSYPAVMISGPDWPKDSRPETWEEVFNTWMCHQ